MVTIFIHITVTLFTQFFHNSANNFLNAFSLRVAAFCCALPFSNLFIFYYLCAVAVVFVFLLVVAAVVVVARSSTSLWTARVAFESNTETERGWSARPTTMCGKCALCRQIPIYRFTRLLFVCAPKTCKCIGSRTHTLAVTGESA